MASQLAERLKDDLKDAMRSGDTQRRNVIRYLQSAIHNFEIEAGREATDDDVIDVVQSQIKQRRDSIDAYEKGGREDLAAQERAELDVLEQYLPAELTPLSDEELLELVASTADELGVSQPADMRILMPALIERSRGRADNRRLSQIASEELRRRSEASAS